MGRKRVYWCSCPMEGSKCPNVAAQLCKKDSMAECLAIVKAHLTQSAYHKMEEEEVDAIVEHMEIDSWLSEDGDDEPPAKARPSSGKGGKDTGDTRATLESRSPMRTQPKYAFAPRTPPKSRGAASSAGPPSATEAVEMVGQILQATRFHWAPLSCTHTDVVLWWPRGLKPSMLSRCLCETAPRPRPGTNPRLGFAGDLLSCRCRPTGPLA
jgi:hypothetical protein